MRAPNAALVLHDSLLQRQCLGIDAVVSQHRKMEAPRAPRKEIRTSLAQRRSAWIWVRPRHDRKDHRLLPQVLWSRRTYAGDIQPRHAGNIRVPGAEKRSRKKELLAPGRSAISEF